MGWVIALEATDMGCENHLTFDHLDLFKRVNEQASTREYRAKEIIFAQGDKADALFYIHDGNVKLTVSSKAAKKKAVVGILRHGDCFGESCWDKGALRMCTATAIETSTVSRVSRATLVRVVNEDHAFGKLFISYLLFRIERIQQEFVDQIFSTSEERLARILLMLAGSEHHSNPESVLLTVNQQTLAEMVGTTRSRVSYFMNRFRTMGYIDYNGSLQVHAALTTVLLHSKNTLVSILATPNNCSQVALSPTPATISSQGDMLYANRHA